MYPIGVNKKNSVSSDSVGGILGALLLGKELGALELVIEEVGVDVGTEVGVYVGLELGTEVGIYVGLELGIEVGIYVGLELGTGVGENVVGLAVGDGVDSAVG